jgi:serine/threonine protein kinase
MRVGNRYELLSRLGEGGMGTVWRAHDELLGRDVAIKEVLLPPELGEAERGERYARTIREARSAARLSHPGVVTVHDVVEHEGRPWIVMELISAPSLQSMIDTEGPLPPKRVAEIGRQILAALQAAHAVGIVHRDVKPSNVLVAAADRAVVTDFGIATLEGDATLTGTGVLIGSPAYIAPERARGEHASPAADLWSLGATLYGAVEGRSPFERSGPVSTLAAIMAEEATPAPNAGPLAPVLAGLLRRNPADRMTAAEADRLLAQAAEGRTRPEIADWTVPVPQPEPAAPWTDPSRRPATLIIASALAGALVVAAFGAVWLLGRKSAGREPTAASTVTTKRHSANASAPAAPNSSTQGSNAVPTLKPQRPSQESRRPSPEDAGLPSIDPAFAGTWSGTMVNPTNNGRFTLQVTFRSGADQGSAFFPATPGRDSCAGTLALRTGTATSMTMTLSVNTPCTPGNVTVSRHSSDRIGFSMRNPKTGRGYAGTLRRA